MLPSRPKPILFITILLILLALLSTISILTSRSAFPRPAAGANPGAAPVAGAGSPSANFQPGTAPVGSSPGANVGGFDLFSIFRSLGLGGQAMLYTNLGATILGILLALVSAFGVWKQKSWGLNLSMLVAVIFLLAVLPEVFNLGAAGLNLLHTTLTILTLAASLPVLVFGFLPSTRNKVMAR